MKYVKGIIHLLLASCIVVDVVCYCRHRVLKSGRIVFVFITDISSWIFRWVDGGQSERRKCWQPIREPDVADFSCIGRRGTIRDRRWTGTRKPQRNQLTRCITIVTFHKCYPRHNHSCLESEQLESIKFSMNEIIEIIE